MGTLAVPDGRSQALHHSLQRHPVRDVGLRVEEDLSAPHVAPAGLVEIAGREVEEVLTGPQHRQVGVVQVEEGLQIGEGVPGEQLHRIGHRDRHPVACRHGDDGGWFQRSFHVNMQFRSGRALPAILPGGGRDPRMRRSPRSGHGTPP